MMSTAQSAPQSAAPRVEAPQGRVTVLRGWSTTYVWEIPPGAARTEVGIGSGPVGWRIDANGVAPRHLDLVWDGEAMWVVPYAPVLVDSTPIASAVRLEGRHVIELGWAALEITTTARSARRFDPKRTMLGGPAMEMPSLDDGRPTIPVDALGSDAAGRVSMAPPALPVPPSLPALPAVASGHAPLVAQAPAMGHAMISPVQGFGDVTVVSKAVSQATVMSLEVPSGPLPAAMRPHLGQVEIAAQPASEPAPVVAAVSGSSSDEAGFSEPPKRRGIPPRTLALAAAFVALSAVAIGVNHTRQARARAMAREQAELTVADTDLDATSAAGTDSAAPATDSAAPATDSAAAATDSAAAATDSAAPATDSAAPATAVVDAEGRTALSRAIDLVAAGRWADAAREYEVLATEHPDDGEYRVIARMLRRRLEAACAASGGGASCAQP
ncbi:FHA domain-containing protein [Sandaracinus amylolyticus]|uniref:Putative Fe-S oxidoreductase n=1 Tax=Sandaracinus amylolyticus TaxID=927083 RepID=A0A0F6W1S3_9BACT|nr:FHA domain-containing protein [Sandaracinus amylolyticus]AKF05230.1 putative Fe-S oxidoreductase [Sandaracinus amylolyticus]